MADNYLEKKMEEYRSGALSRPNVRRHSPSGARPGTVSFKIDQLRVLVTDGSTNAAQAVIRKLRDAGCRVAFVSADDKAGRTLSQATGSRYYPAAAADGAMSDLREVWGGVDALIVVGSMRPPAGDQTDLKKIIIVADDPSVDGVARGEGLTVNGISTRDIEPDSVAHLCLLLCLKDSGFIDGKIF